MPEDLLGSPFDVAVLGEGEETFLDLLKHFDQSGALTSDHLPGLAYQEGHRLVKTPPRPLIADLDKVPQPDYSLFAMREHYTRPRALAHGFYAKGASLMPSRGCPYGNCSFCGSNLMWQRRVRFFSPQRVFQEMQHLIETYGLNSIIFLDDNFTTNRAPGWRNWPPWCGGAIFSPISSSTANPSPSFWMTTRPPSSKAWAANASSSVSSRAASGFYPN